MQRIEVGRQPRNDVIFDRDPPSCPPSSNACFKVAAPIPGPPPSAAFNQYNLLSVKHSTAHCSWSLLLFFPLLLSCSVSCITRLIPCQPYQGRDCRPLPSPTTCELLGCVIPTRAHSGSTSRKALFTTTTKYPATSASARCFGCLEDPFLRPDSPIWTLIVRVMVYLT